MKTRSHKAKSFSITLPGELFARLDKLAQLKKRTRSDIIRSSLEEELERHQDELAEEINPFASFVEWDDPVHDVFDKM